MHQDSEPENAARDSMPLYKALVFAERYRREGRLAEADALCRRVLEAQPNSYEAEHLLGTIAHQTGKLGPAIEHFRRTVKLAPEVALHHANLGEVYRLASQMDEAIAASQHALELDPELAEPWNNLALIATERREPQQALDYCRRALALKPDYVDAYNNMGNVLKELGNLEEARLAYLRAIKANPSRVTAYVNLAEVHTFVPGDPYLAAMEALAQSDDLTDAERSYLDFALGNAYRDVKDYRRSFHRYSFGNAGMRARIDYDEKSKLALFGHIERIFTPELIKTKSGGGYHSSVPIFVLGMPRSGTTLVEQILASHPQVHGAGELNTFAEAMLSVRGPDGRPLVGPAFVPALEARTFSEIGERYLAAIRKLAPAAAHVTDKRTNNYYLIGLIHLALPDAKIIHVIRDPVDTCFSCFTKFFAVENQMYDLAELGRYYKRYERLMAHWRRVLPPGRILDVRYENVVANLEGETRRMLDYCALPWDKACLAFHETKRPVRTVSAVQVRQPLYDRSVGSWRPYEEFLDPLLKALELSGGKDTDGASDTKR